MYEQIYKKLLRFYPESYRQRFKSQILLDLEDLYHDELRAKGKAGAGFWTFQLMDLSKGIIFENIYEMQEVGMKKYFHLNNFNIAGAVLLLPILLMSVIDFSSRVAQGNLGHINQQSYNFFSHTFLYRAPVLFTWVLFFPFLAVLLNIVSLVKDKRGKNKMLSLEFVKNNFATLFILVIGLGFLAMIRLHDFLPCIMHGIFSKGFGNVFSLFSYCRNA